MAERGKGEKGTGKEFWRRAAIVTAIGALAIWAL